MGNNALDHGQWGFDFISDTDTHTASVGWYGVFFIEDTVFATLTMKTDDDDYLVEGDTITGETFPKGAYVPIRCTVIDLTSGACIAFKERGSTTS